MGTNVYFSVSVDWLHKTEICAYKCSLYVLLNYEY